MVISTKLDNSGLKAGLKGIPSALSGIKSSLAGIGGLLAAAFSVTAIINFGKEAIELGSDLAEVQNVVDVTFGSMSSRVNQFAKDAMKSFGLSEKVAKQYMGTFGAMSKAFGYSTDAAYEQAAALTALTGDVASFYNLSTDEAFNKLKGVYSGETEGLKALGVVMTQTALDEFALANGFGKTTKSMSEQEKVALRLAFVTERLSGASGDFSRTSDGWANQTRVLSLQLESLKAAIGQGLINVLTPLLKMLNELIAKLVVVAEKFKAFTQLVFGDAGSTTSAVTAAADSAGEISSNIDSASESAKELKKQLAGFDKLNVLGSDSDSSGDSGTSSTITDVTSTEEWDKGETVLSMTIEEAEELKKKLEDILGVVMAVSAGLLTWKLTHSVGLSFVIAGIALEADGIRKALQDGLNKINFAEIIGGGGLTIAGGALLGAKFGSALLGGGIGAVIAGLPMYFVGIYDAIVNELNALNASLIPIGSTLAGTGIGAIIGSLGGPIGAGIGALIGIVIGLTTDFVIWFWQEYEKIKSWFMNIPSWAQFLVIAFSNLSPMIRIVRDVVVAIKEWDTLAAWVKTNVIEPICNFFEQITIVAQDAWIWLYENVFSSVGDFFEPFKTAATEVWTWLDENLFIPISDAFTEVKEYATEKFTEIKDGVVLAFSVIWSKVVEIVAKIKEIFTALKWAFQEYIWNPLKEKVKDFYSEYIVPIVEKIKAFASTVWNFIKENVIDKIAEGIASLIELIASIVEKIKAFASTVWNFIKENVIDKIAEKIADLIELCKSIGTDVVDFIAGTFKSVINGVLSAIESAINRFIRMLNSAIGVINKIPGVNISPVSEIQIPRLAQGAVIPANKEFLAVLGDQKNGRNLELPENLLRQIVREESGGNRSGIPFIIQLILNGKVIGEEAVEYVNGVIRKTGKSPIKQGG
ncbi:MAG: hypothetical protein IJD49_04175 [Clostridia bacterium]|nr:hypothetical protein [Clostridia bacterium]